MECSCLVFDRGLHDSSRVKNRVYNSSRKYSNTGRNIFYFLKFNESRITNLILLFGSEVKHMLFQSITHRSIEIMLVLIIILLVSTKLHQLIIYF